MAAPSARPGNRPMIRALLIDLSGTLHIGSNPTPSAVKALQRLRDAGIPFRFCSNTSKESTDSLTERLRSMGFDVRSDGPGRELWTSIGAVTAALHKFGLNRPYYLLSDSARKEVEAGLAPRAAGGSDAHDAVVIGLDPPSFDYAHLNEAFRLLTGEARGVSGPGAAPRTRARLIATHKAKYIEGTAPPGLSLGPGPFVAALEYASGAQAHVVGKPSAEFFQMVIDDLGPTASGDGVIAVVGDDVDADLGGGAVQLGLWRVLVKTGKYRSGDEQKPAYAQERVDRRRSHSLRQVNMKRTFCILAKLQGHSLDFPSDLFSSVLCRLRQPNAQQVPIHDCQLFNRAALLHALYMRA